MKKYVFNWLWNQIEMSIADIENSINSRFEDRWNFRRRYQDSEAQSIIHQEYNKIKNQLKSRVYRNNFGSRLIDQHKIAACFCNAFLNKKMYVFDMDDDIPGEILLSNYQLAYTVSLRIIYIFLVERYLSSDDPNMRKLAQTLLDRKTLAVPATTRTHDAYHLGRIKTLALNEYYHIEFDILGYSTIMFWIEYYNRQLLENRIIPYELDENGRFVTQ